MKVKISDAFDYYPGNHGLTEEIIYQYKPTNKDDRVPIFSGSKDNKIPIGFIQNNVKNLEGKDIKCFDAPCLILTKDGSAGLLTYKEKGNFTLNHHACVLKVKPEFFNKIDMEWFAYQYQKRLYQYVTSKSDNGVFSTEWFDRVLFEITDYNIQIRQKNKKNKLKTIIYKLGSLVEALEQIRNNNAINLSFGSSYYIKDIFMFKGGNSGLTAGFIYNNKPNNELENVPILSGATVLTNMMGFVSRNAMPDTKKLKIFNGPAIIVIRNGVNAGQMIYIDKGEFATNDHVYVMSVKNNWKNKVNLRWFSYQYQELFYNLITSKSDNATFNKEYVEKQKVLLPDKNIDYQNNIAETLINIDNLISKLTNKIKKMKDIIEAEILIEKNF